MTVVTGGLDTDSSSVLHGDHQCAVQAPLGEPEHFLMEWIVGSYAAQQPLIESWILGLDDRKDIVD
jgi:hypothetical protein